MALRPLVSKFRLVLYPPVAILKLLLELVAGKGFSGVARFFRWMNNGAKTHLWRVLLIARRWTLSKPTWMAEDLLNGGTLFQPFTKAQRAQADADERLRHVMCPCGQPERCDVPRGLYIPNIVIPDGLEELVQREFKRVNAALDVSITRTPPGN